MSVKKKIRIGVIGIAGRMGREISKVILEDDRCILSGGLENKNSKFIGQNLDLIIGNNNLDLTITDNINKFFSSLDVVIEFGAPDATKNYIKECCKRRVALISGTTGLDKNTKDEIVNASKIIPILWAPNMSIGANVAIITAKFITCIPYNEYNNILKPNLFFANRRNFNSIINCNKYKIKNT